MAQSINDFLDQPEQPTIDEFLGPEESTYQRITPEPIKNAIGGIESMGRMLWNFPASIAAQGVGNIAGLVANRGDIGKAVETGSRAAEAVTIKPFTEQGALADEMMGKGFEAVRDTWSDISAAGEEFDPNAPRDLITSNPRLEAVNRFLAEAPFDILMARLGLQAGAGMAKGIVNTGKAIKAQQAAKKEQVAREAAFEAGKKVELEQKAYTDAYNQLDNTMIKEPSKYTMEGMSKEGIRGGELRAPQYGIGKKQKGIPTRKEMQAEYEALIKEAQEAKTAPLEFPKETPPEFGLEQTGGMGGPIQFPVVRNWAEVPTHARQAPLDVLPMERGTAPTMERVPLDPAQRATAVDLLADPMFQREVTRLSNIDSQIQTLLKEYETPEIISRPEILKQERARLIDQYNDPVIQRGLEMNEAIGLNRAKALTERIAKLDENISKAEKIAEDSRTAISNKIESLNREKQRLEARVLAGVDWADMMVQRRGAQIHKTQGFDGPHQTVPVSFWDAMPEAVSRSIERTADRPVRLPRSQRGEISLDLLQGVADLIKKIGSSETLKKFTGTYADFTIRKAIREHFAPVVNDWNNMRLGWVSPDFFHEMAKKRPPEALTDRGEFGSPIRAEKAAGYMKGQIGLNTMPKLTISQSRIVDGELILNVMGHDGRHRMDAFKMFGLDRTPVQYRMFGETIRAIEKAQEKGMPIRLMSEDRLAVADFPGFMKIEKGDFAETRGPVLPKSQAGSADKRLLADITTGGLASLLGEGIKKVVKAKEALTRKTPEKKPTEINSSSAQGILDAASGETRTLGEWKQAMGEKLAKLEDIKKGFQLTMGDIVNADFLHQVSGSPLVKYVMDKVNNIYRMSHLNIKLLREQTVGRTPNPNSPIARLEALNKSERQLLNRLAEKYAGIYELTKTDLQTLGANQKVIDAYQTVRKAYDQVLDAVNEINPDSPLIKAPGYFNRVRSGDFKLDVVDPVTGKKVWSDLFSTKIGRAITERELRKRFSEEGYTFERSVIDRDRRGNPYNTSTVPFEELMATLRKEDPRFAAIESAAREIKSRRGWGRHRIQSEHIPGRSFDVKHGFEQYVTSAYQYIANSQTKQLIRELINDVDINAPNTKRWAQMYGELATGGFKPGWLIDKISEGLEATWSGMGLSPSSLYGTIRGANNYFMAKALFFWRPVFLGVQAAQPLQFIPQHLAHMKTKGFDASIINAMYEGTKELSMMGMGKADPQFKKFIKEYQIPRGNIDPTLVQALDLFGEGNMGRHSFADWVVGKPPAQFVEMFGRMETSAVAYHYLKNAGLKGKELFMEAEALTNRIMVDYSRQERPGFIAKTGVVGNLFGPLSTFVTNFWSSTLMFMHDIAKNPAKATSYQPMAIHIAQTALWGGLTGMLGVTVVDKLIDILKTMGLLSPKTKTLSERILTNTDLPDMEIMGVNARDAAQFGVPSALTGSALSQSFAAPDMRLPGIQSMPGIALITDIVSSLWDSMVKEKTKTARQRALKAVLPNSLGSAIDVYDIDPQMNLLTNPDGFRLRSSGEIIPDINKRGFGLTTMSEEEQMRRLLGTKSLKQARELAGVRATTQKEQSINEKKTILVDRAADNLMGVSGAEDLDVLMREAMDLGIPPKQFLSRVQETIISRQFTTKAERAYGVTPSTPNQLRRYETIEEFQNR